MYEYVRVFKPTCIIASTAAATLRFPVGRLLVHPFALVLDVDLHSASPPPPLDVYCGLLPRKLRLVYFLAQLVEYLVDALA